MNNIYSTGSVLYHSLYNTLYGNIGIPHTHENALTFNSDILTFNGDILTYNE